MTTNGFECSLQYDHSQTGGGARCLKRGNWSVHSRIGASYGREEKDGEDGDHDEHSYLAAESHLSFVIIIS
jgi:hypothetical protein